MIPDISVIMPVYNTKEEYLREAIDSILMQSFTNFELIIVDDCSNEETVGILETYTDNRIKIYHNEKNLGVAGSLNQAIRMSRGKYIARMDSDDISVSERLQWQWEYMEKHPDTIVLGGVAQVVGSKELLGILGRKKKKDIQLELHFNNINLVHPTVMFRAKALRSNSLLYNEEVVAEDYDMWTRCIQYGDIESISKILLYYRIHESQVTTSKREKIVRSTNEVRLKQLMNIGGTLDEHEKIIFDELREYRCSANGKELNRLLDKLEVLFRNKGYSHVSPLLWHYWICIMKKKGYQLLKYRRTYCIFIPEYFLYVFQFVIVEKMWRKYVATRLHKLG